MRPLHTRVVVLTYFEDDLKTHIPTEDPDKFFRALGRAVAYGLPMDQDEDTVQLVALSIQDKEFLNVYHRPSPAYDKWEDGRMKALYSRISKVHNLQEMLGEERPFVMGAVKDEDGTYGFHS
jgi:hypothetical protein